MALNKKKTKAAHPLGTLLNTHWTAQLFQKNILAAVLLGIATSNWEHALGNSNELDDLNVFFPQFLWLNFHESIYSDVSDWMLFTCFGSISQPILPLPCAPLIILVGLKALWLWKHFIMKNNTILICLEKTNIYIQVGLLYFCNSFVNTAVLYS